MLPVLTLVSSADGVIKNNETQRENQDINKNMNIQNKLELMNKTKNNWILY